MYSSTVWLHFEVTQTCWRRLNRVLFWLSVLTLTCFLKSFHNKKLKFVKISDPARLIGFRIDKFQTLPEIFAKNIALHIKFCKERLYSFHFFWQFRTMSSLIHKKFALGEYGAVIFYEWWYDRVSSKVSIPTRTLLFSIRSNMTGYKTLIRT